MRGEQAAAAGKDAENRRLGAAILNAFTINKPNGRFVLQWRMFPKAQSAAASSCGCGCSCGCG